MTAAPSPTNTISEAPPVFTRAFDAQRTFFDAAAKT